jgi:large subunit ribosomal protein L3
MGKVDGPRHGSMQYWPRKRARSEKPRIHARVLVNPFKIDGFCGYKVGMTQISVKDTYQNSLSKNQVIIKPVTIIECPPVKVAGIRFYKKSYNDSLVPSYNLFADKFDKELSKSMIIPKLKNKIENPEFDDLRLVVYTQPKLTGFGKKKPEIMEIAVSGTKEEKLAYAKEKLGKEIDVSEAFKVNEFVDIHAVTKGKGNQGPVKRFGVQIRSHKSEKTKRGPGSLGSWRGQQHMMYRVAHSGQTGYHLRTENNKSIIYVGNEPEKVNPQGGFVNYGDVKSTYLMVVGSVAGQRKRLVRITHALRPNPKKKPDKLNITYIDVTSKQGK